MSDSVPPSERRAGERYLACFPAALYRPDGQERPSLIRDLSIGGVMLLVRTTKIAVGDHVKLALYIAEDTSSHRDTAGNVVRVEELGPEEAGPWLRRVAVQFDTPLTMYEADVAAFIERSKRLGIGK
jgi:hypothetical protein